MTGGRGKKEVLVAVLGCLLFSPLSLSADQKLQIRIRDTGSVYWETRFSSPLTFTLRHQNSIYDVWVEERFLADDRCRIRLTAIRTPSPAVLEYYGLETASTAWIPLSRTFDVLHLLISFRGRVTLFLPPEKIPLSDLLPDGTRIEIRVVEASK